MNNGALVFSKVVFA